MSNTGTQDETPNPETQVTQTRNKQVCSLNIWTAAAWMCSTAILLAVISFTRHRFLT